MLSRKRSQRLDWIRQRLKREGEKKKRGREEKGEERGKGREGTERGGREARGRVKERREWK